MKYKDYLYTKNLALNIEQLKNSTNSMKNFIESCFIADSKQNTTSVFYKYNLLMYPLPEYHSLYKEIVKAFKQFYKVEGEYYMQSWLNVYYKGTNLDWHTHWPKELGVFHGFYCLDVEKEASFTEYKWPNEKETVKIPSKDNLLVIGKSNGDLHRTSVWNSDSQRITIAFDIVPRNAINYSDSPNHWIPIV